MKPVVGIFWSAVVCLLSSAGAQNCRAAEYLLTPETDLKPLLSRVRAGDTLVLQNGVWQDAELTFESLPGTAEAEIRIQAQQPGQVVLTGATQFRLSGSYVTVSGLVFRDTDDVSDVVQLRTHSQRHAHHCRLTDCVFQQTADADTGIESRWLSVYGSHNRIDHCYFVGKRSRGTTVVVWVDTVVGAHRIDHNHFGHRPELGKNGGETIRIGTSEVSELTCQTIVEDNYFHACDGEAEVVSNKSCENIFRRNLFDACAGAVTLRHGHRCLVDSNVFRGQQKSGTGGVRIIGSDHVVTNNYFEGLRGDAERAAVCLMNGIPDGPLNGYAPVTNAQVLHNTFVDCKVSLEFGVGAGTRQSAAATNCRLTHNLLAPGKWELLRLHAQPVDMQWNSNLRQPGSRSQDLLWDTQEVDVQLHRGSDGLLRPVAFDSLQTQAVSGVSEDVDGNARGSAADFAGCDAPGSPRQTWPSPDNTGPAWLPPPQR